MMSEVAEVTGTQPTLWLLITAHGAHTPKYIFHPLSFWGSHRVEEGSHRVEDNTLGANFAFFSPPEVSLTWNWSAWIVPRRVEEWVQHLDGLWVRTRPGDSFREGQGFPEGYCQVGLPWHQTWVDIFLPLIFFKFVNKGTEGYIL